MLKYNIFVLNITLKEFSPKDVIPFYKYFQTSQLHLTITIKESLSSTRGNIVYCILLNNGYLGTYLQKNNKTHKQTKQAKNGKKRKKEDKKRNGTTQDLNPGTFGCMRFYFTTTPRRLITSIRRSLKCHKAYFFERIKQLAEKAIANIQRDI